jgi:hypothetical protein
MDIPVKFTLETKVSYKVGEDLSTGFIKAVNIKVTEDETEVKYSILDNSLNCKISKKEEELISSLPEKTNFHEFLETLNNKEICQHGYWLEDLPDNLFSKISNSIVSSNLHIDRHRWYETSVDVFKYGKRFIGVRHVSNVYSETASIFDIRHILKFFEVVPTITTTYKRK